MGVQDGRWGWIGGLRTVGVLGVLLESGKNYINYIAQQTKCSINTNEEMKKRTI